MKVIRAIPLWLIPAAYTVLSVIVGFTMPRLEAIYLPDLQHGMSVGSALAAFSAVCSGMMALLGIVFAIAFVTVQFSAVAYSPRIVAMFADDPALYHSLGIFFATFFYSLVALSWTDRDGSGRVPLVSTALVLALLIVSMLAFVRLIGSLKHLQIQNVLQTVGAQGRAVILTMFPERPVGAPAAVARLETVALELGQETQTLTYSGRPRAIARFDIATLVAVARSAGGVIAIESAVGDTLLDGSVLLRLHGASRQLPEDVLLRSVHLSDSRTYEQDPKYALRLLVDIAIRALSPAVNDPTTAVQALDQIEDLLRRLGRADLDIGRVRDQEGALRLIVPMPTWDDYLALSFDEIRQFGVTSVQVARRLRAALSGLGDHLTAPDRQEAVRLYLGRLDTGIRRSVFDDQDKIAALQEDRQGLGLSRKHVGRQV